VKYFLKRYWLLLIVQSACLAFGLWLEHRFVVSSVPRDSQQHETASQPGNATAVGKSAATAPRASLKTANAELPAVGIYVLAFVWIAGLQIAAAYLLLMRDQEEASRKSSKAESVSLQQYNELLRTRDAVIFGLAKLTESRDLETGHHLERISVYSTRLAAAARHDPRFSSQITPAFVKLIGISSVLHDIGKVGIRDSILLKPGELEHHEKPVMQSHAEIGGNCIREIESRLGRSNFLAMAREIAFCHHERWDGQGYPKGLAGEEIPLAARIVSIADVYDALSANRVYRQALPHKMCVEVIRREAGRQFDPALVDIFLKLESDFREIAQNYRDESHPGKVPPSATEAPIIAVEREASIDEKIASLQAALDLCADSPQFAADSPPEMPPRSAESTDLPAPPARASALELSTEEVEKETDYVV
jgi:putative two-component system response regulator